mgnify:CR=1 FL=1
MNVFEEEISQRQIKLIEGSLYEDGSFEVDSAVERDEEDFVLAEFEVPLLTWILRIRIC